jgi:hypothetical protein
MELLYSFDQLPFQIRAGCFRGSALLESNVCRKVRRWSRNREDHPKVRPLVDRISNSIVEVKSAQIAKPVDSQHEVFVHLRGQFDFSRIGQFGRIKCRRALEICLG